MDNIGRLFGQVAAEAGVTENRAKMATYLFGMSSRGATLAEACHSLRRKPDTIKATSRDFLIDFADYRPFAKEREKAEIKPRVQLRLGDAA